MGLLGGGGGMWLGNNFIRTQPKEADPTYEQVLEGIVTQQAIWVEEEYKKLAEKRTKEGRPPLTPEQ